MHTQGIFCVYTMDGILGAWKIFMKKDKLFAPFLMLLAGAVVSLMMYFFHYSSKEMLPVLLIVLVVFYIAGSFIQMKVNSFVWQINEEIAAKEAEEAEKAEEVPEMGEAGEETESAGAQEDGET